MKRKDFFFPALLFISLLQVSCQTTVDSLKNEKRVEVTSKTPLRVEKDNNLTLVLGGGGARGIAHLAVIEALEEEGIPIDFIVGCSSGSIVGSLYAANKGIKDLKNLFFKAKKKHIINRDKLSYRFGIMQHKQLRQFLKKNLKTLTFEDLKIPLIIVATDLITGELVEYDSGSLIPPVIGSSSVPFLFEPIKYDNRILVDGGVVAPLPVASAKKLNPRMIIAVDIGKDLPLEKPKNPLGVARRSIEIMHEKLSKEQSRLADVVIRPRMEMGLFDSKKAQEFYLVCKEEAKAKMPLIRKLYHEKVTSKKSPKFE